MRATGVPALSPDQGDTFPSWGGIRWGSVRVSNPLTTGSQPASSPSGSRHHGSKGRDRTPDAVVNSHSFFH